MRRVSARRGYGWLPDLPDHRDQLFATPTPHFARLPARADLRRRCPPVYDQGVLGSCTANAVAAAIQFERRRQRLKPDFMPSRLFIYYNERVMEHSVDADAGAQLRDGIKSVARQGVCPEAQWPYQTARFAARPDRQCYIDALNYKAVLYQRVPVILNQMKGCLATGFPFVFGFSAYTAFAGERVARTGRLNMPGPRERLIGGHAVMAVGYSDATERFVLRNSWGRSWGVRGYFTMPYAYITDPNLTADFWTIRLESAP